MNSTVTRRVVGVVLGEALDAGAARVGREAAMQAAPKTAATFERGALRGAAPAPGTAGALPSAITNPMNVIRYSRPAPAAMSAEHRAASEAVDALTTRLGQATAAQRPAIQAQLEAAQTRLQVHETRAAVEHMTHVIRHTPATQPDHVVRSLYQRLAEGQARHAEALTRAGASEAEIIAAHNAAGHSFARAARTDLQSVGRAWTEDMGAALRHFAAAGDHRSISEMFRRADAGQTEAALGLLRGAGDMNLPYWQRTNMEAAARGMLDDMWSRQYTVQGALRADGTREPSRVLNPRGPMTDTEFATVARRARGSDLASDTRTWFNETLRVANPR